MIVIEGVTKERKQTEAEDIELKKVMEWMNEMVRKGYSPEEAKEIVQIERGKVKKIIQEVKKTYGVSNNIVKLAESVVKKILTKE